jgi:hypothetical protein
VTATLELQLDPSGIRRGAAEAERSLADLDRASQRTAAYVDGIYSTLGQRSESAARGVRNLGDAFQSVGGSLQVGQGISQVLQSLQRADIAGAGTNVARTLLEISKTGHDFRQLASGVGATGGAFATLLTVMAAHPILTIATAIGLAASAFSLFSSGAEKAKTAVDALAASQERLKQSLQSIAGADAIARIRERTGGSISQQESVRARIGGLESLLADLDTNPGRNVDLESLSRISDIDQIKLLQMFDRQPNALGVSSDGQAALRRDLTLQVLEGRLRFLNQINGRFSDRSAAAQYDIDADHIAGPFAGFGRAKQASEQQDLERQKVAMEQFQAQVQELRQVGAEVGSTFASAFESVISGANSAREAVAALARSLGSSLLQSVFRNLGANLGGLFAGSGPSDRTRSVDAPGWQQA